jgi:hypothetical protein
MDTFACELLTSTKRRWAEIELLLKHTEEVVEDSELSNSLCRSVVVLLVAHFEGFVRDLTRAILKDINKFSTFKKSPRPLKLTFCRLFIDGDDKESNLKKKKLLDLLEMLEAKFTEEAFFLENKNPTPGILQKICNNFGVKDFFLLLEKSDTEIVFSEEQPGIDEFLKKITDYVTEGIKTFPYTIDLIKLNIGSVSEREKNYRTIWETFVDDLLEKRHSIAHGSSIDNSLSIPELKLIKNKLLILQFSLVAVVCAKSVVI